MLAMRPDWFTIIDRWIPERMGDSGVTLPFLVGALLYLRGESLCSSSVVEDVLHDMVRHPVDDRSVMVSWCSYIDAPVLHIVAVSTYVDSALRAALLGPDGLTAAMVFGANLMWRWESIDPQELMSRLVRDASAYVSNGQFSRRRLNGASEYSYGALSSDELAYVRRIVSHD
jgi:hypothetical protein